MQVQRSLTLTQLLYVTVATLLLTLIFLAFQLSALTRQHQARQVVLLQQVQESAYRPMTVAAWEINDALAIQTLHGILALDGVQAGRLTLLEGRRLADLRQVSAPDYSAMATWLFGPPQRLTRNLYAPNASGDNRQVIATLELEGDPTYLLQSWIDTAWVTLLSSLVQAILIALVLTTLFHRFLTRPLISLGHAMGALDPMHPGGRMLQTPKGHEKDELGMVVTACNNHLRALADSQISLTRMATRDGLTGLANRALLMETLAQRIETAQSQDASFALLMIDLDRFKNINDSLGHQQGDALLQQVAMRLQQTLPKGVLVARLGSDEFVALLPTSESPEAILDHVEDMLGHLREPVELEGMTISPSASVGIALFPEDGDNPDLLMRHADVAMNSAKNDGVQQWAFFKAELTEQARIHLQIENNLLKAIHNGEFQLYFQPKLAIKTRQVTGCEALLRWIRQDGQIISPAQFIPIAEETKLILPLGDWVLEEACRTLHSWIAQQCAVPIAINVAPAQLLNPGFSQRLATLLSQYAIPSQLLEIEITETTIMRNLAKATQVLEEVRKLGLKVALDDFGTGYSSLSYVQRLPLDILKADRSFVAKLPNDSAVTRIISSLGNILGIEVVAEGVETPAQLHWLAEHGFDTVQGFLFSPPIAREMFEQRYLLPNKSQQKDSQAS
ncbi:putative bifunctional diguanylate cyclase/phosphodiesterase [Balneatrix alpica]|uniref:Bifunctional diguanylate cyclase/phosphodiesterase n=1 Tax=Balneatrix alpica TaxID=75684 RepID=A0ABV5ZAX5_9GAMM|nr:EAL domain-containing protein [Balneatrix alpica]